MDLQYTQEENDYRARARAWLEENLVGDFAALRGTGGPGNEHLFVDERIAWTKHMAAAGWNCIGWPKEHGGQSATLREEVIWNEEYVRAEAPGRIGHVGETLLGPTIIAYGSDEQKKRFLPGIVSGENVWCQGYSEPNAGSDLANVQTKAELVGDEWVLNGQKVWTSLAPWSDWCFVVARTDPDSKRHKGLGYFLVPMKQEGVEVVPIKQITGDSEFAETFFDDAKTPKENIVGAPGEGWKIAMGTLAFERGASTLGQQQFFEAEFERVKKAAQENGKAEDPVYRQRLADAWIGLKIMRINALRVLSNDSADASLAKAGMTAKLYWSNWHRDFGKLAMDVLGPQGELIEEAPYECTIMQKTYLFARSDTIYAGSNQIQRNIIGERALGLPREPR